MKLEIKDPSGRIIQTVDLADGEYTLALSSTDPVHVSSTAAAIGNTALVPRVIGLIFLSLFLFNVDQYIDNAHQNLENIVFVKNALGMLVSILIFVGFLSFISRALTHRFQIWQCANFLLMSFLGYFIWANNLLGLRWFLPKIFWITEVYNILFLGLMAWVLWHLMRLLLVQMSATWRKALVSLMVVVVIVYNLINFLPFRREYNYYKITTPPPRPAILESTPISVDAFLDEVKEH